MVVFYVNSWIILSMGRLPSTDPVFVLQPSLHIAVDYSFPNHLCLLIFKITSYFYNRHRNAFFLYFALDS